MVTLILRPWFKAASIEHVIEGKKHIRRANICFAGQNIANNVY